MAELRPMPEVVLAPAELAELSIGWDAGKCTLSKSAGEKVGKLCNGAVAAALAHMLGGIPQRVVSMNRLLPEVPECVELGHPRVIGGIRPQSFDVAYRPDGVRFAFDSKTLNTKSSFSKNYQNMINDIGLEAATVHTRFPSAVVAFVVAVPTPCLGSHRAGLMGALSRLCGRPSANGDLVKAEAIAIAAYDPTTGFIDPEWPPREALRLDHFSQQVEAAYVERFAGLPPHVVRDKNPPRPTKKAKPATPSPEPGHSPPK